MSKDEATRLQPQLEGVTMAAPTAPPDATARRGTEVDVPLEWNIGDVILGTYEVTGILGEGGMGKVYKVHHRGWNVDLAVKSPRPEIFAKAGGQENFSREAETWVNLGLHPHTVSCYYVRTLGGIPRVFAEYVVGGSLKDWIQTRKLYAGGHEQALARILDIAIQFAWGLHYAHEQGLVHQDVKPANVMMTLDGAVKVTDFGLARARAMAGEVAGPREGRSILVSAGGMTPAYCSPEQVAGKPLSRKTDIWSWGLSILEMFVGGVTWLAGQVAAEVLAGYLEMGSEDPSIPAMPWALATLLERCFQRTLDDRPATMTEIAIRLQDIYQQEVGHPYLRKAPRPAKTLADSLNNRAVSLLDLEKEEDAGRLWEEALNVDPHHPEATFNRGVALWRRGKLTDEMLVQQLEAVRTTHSGDWIDEYLLALVHLERGDVESAVQLLEEAAQRAPEEPEVQATLKLARSGEIAIGRCLRTFRGHTGLVESVCLSGDGCWALSASGDPLNERDNMLRLWDLATGRCLRTFRGHTDTVTSTCLSTDGRFALSGSQDRTLQLWEVATARCLRTFKGHTGWVSSVCLSTDGRYALSGSDDKTLKLWEAATGRCLRTFKGHTWFVNSVCLSADGRYALSGAGSSGRWKDNTLKLWDLATGHCLRTFEGHTDSVTSVCLSANGRWALSGSYDKTLRLWEVATGRCVQIFLGHVGAVSSVYLSADGHWALSGSGAIDKYVDKDNTIRFWEVATGRCLRTFEAHAMSVSSVCLSADGRSALSGSGSTLLLWKMPYESVDICSPHLSQPWSHTELMEIETQMSKLLEQGKEALGESRFIVALTLVREAREMPGSERTPQSMEAWARLSLFSQRVGLRAAWLAKTFEGHKGPVTSVCLSTDGFFALSGSDDNTLRLWEVTTGRCLRVFKGHTDNVTSVCLGADGHFALSGSRDCTLRLWEVATGRCVRIFQGNMSFVYSVCLSADERFALSGSNDKTPRLWEVATGRCVRIFRWYAKRNYVKSVCLSADGRWALSGGDDKTLRLWEVATGRCLRTFKGHGRDVNAVCFSTDGHWALSGSGGGRFLDVPDTSLRLWDVATGRCLQTFKGHTSAVNSVCLSSGRRFVFSASSDTTLRLWKVSTGRCLRVFEGHTGPAYSVYLSRDGRWMLSGSHDCTLQLWELDWELEARESADWDEGARPYLETFLTLHTPYAAPLPQDKKTKVTHAFGDLIRKRRHIRQALIRHGQPVWSEEDFQGLIRQLQYVGYGWLRRDGVRQELEKMAREWQSPPPLPGT